MIITVLIVIPAIRGSSGNRNMAQPTAAAVLIIIEKIAQFFFSLPGANIANERGRKTPLPLSAIDK